MDKNMVAKRLLVLAKALVADEGDKCGEKGCIRKVDGGWGVMSGKTGKMWPQTYKTKEDAEDALRRYHGFGFKKSSEHVAAQFKVWDDSYIGDMYRSLRSLVKSNDGLWKSDKQGKFILNRVLRSGQTDTDKYVVKQARNYAPAGTRGAIYTSMDYNPNGMFGRKGRILAYIYWIDTHGILQEAKVKYKYDEQGGAYPVGLGVTWTRPSDIEFEDDESEDEKWVRERKEQIKRVIDALKDDSYWSKWTEQLREGFRVPDKVWLAMMKATVKAESKKDLNTFPTVDYKGEIVMKVKKVKADSSEFGYHVNFFYVLMGDIEGYKEFGYIKIGESTMEKFIGIGLSTTATSDISDKLVGKKVTLRGTFKSNGKMVFGTRVRPLKIG